VNVFHELPGRGTSLYAQGTSSPWQAMVEGDLRVIAGSALDFSYLNDGKPISQPLQSLPQQDGSSNSHYDCVVVI